MIQTKITTMLINPNGEDIFLPTTFTYLPDDPFAVEIKFFNKNADHPDGTPRPGGQNIHWTISRELLAAGCKDDTGRDGEGDVRIWPSVNKQTPLSLFMSLCSHEGEALVDMDKREVEEFLAATYELIPEGAEVADVDSFIAELFS